MQSLSRDRIIIHAVLVLLVFSSCMPQKRTVNDRTPVELTRTTSEKYVVQGDFKKALDVCAAACRLHPADQGLLANYHLIIEDIRHAADDAFDKGDFALSGRAYYALLNNYPHYHELLGEVSFDKASLHARLEVCGSNLSQRALTKYRKGDITEAISLWKSILAFDPKNTDIKKALDTATIQLKNIQEDKE